MREEMSSRTVSGASSMSFRAIFCRPAERDSRDEKSGQTLLPTPHSLLPACRLAGQHHGTGFRAGAVHRKG